MRGFPKYLNSKADYDYVAKNFPPEKRERDFFGALIEDSQKFVEVRVLTEGEKITPSETQKIVEAVDPATNKKIQSLFELQADPNCKMARLGLQTADVKAISDESAKPVDEDPIKPVDKDPIQEDPLKHVG